MAHDSSALRALRAYASSLVAEAHANTLPVVVAQPAAATTGLFAQRVAALAAASMLVMATAGIATASDSAVPGELLYPIDRMVESVGSLFGFERGAASERGAEAAILLGRGNVLDAVTAAKESAIAAVDAGSRADVAAAMDSALAEHAAVLDAPREAVFAALTDLITAAHRASSGESGSADVVDAAHHVAAVAKGGSGNTRGDAVGRNGDPPRNSPQPGGGSPVSGHGEVKPEPAGQGAGPVGKGAKP